MSIIIIDESQKKYLQSWHSKISIVIISFIHYWLIIFKWGISENDTIAGIPISVDTAYKHLISGMDFNISMKTSYINNQSLQSQIIMPNQMPIFLAIINCNIANKKLHQINTKYISYPISIDIELVVYGSLMIKIAW